MPRCGTRLYGRPDQVGKKVKCPDCGSLSIVPPPPKLKPKNMPAADSKASNTSCRNVDSQPLSSELIAAQPKYVAVKCRKCGTLMYATEKRVSQQIACPDCGAKTWCHPRRRRFRSHQFFLHEAEMPGLDPRPRIRVSGRL